MLLQHLKILVDYYVRPLSAPARALDEGRLFWAVLIGLSVALLIQAPSRMASSRAQAEMQMYLETHDADEPASAAQAKAEFERYRNWQKSILDERPAPAVALLPAFSIKQWLAVAFVFVPLAVIALAWWEGTGTGPAVLSREYTPALVCLSMAWSAAHVPLIPLAWFGVRWPWLGAASMAYFVFLAMCSLRTSPGTSLARAGVVALGGAAASAAGAVALQVSQPMVYMLASPCILYYLYASYGGGLSGLGSGLRSQQSYRRYLETTTLNPRDADAHYQLGCIHKQRRNLKQAEASFRRAVEIDAQDPDYLLALGRLLHETAGAAPALPYLESAARIAPKASSHETVRDYAAALLDAGRNQEAADLLAGYVGHREYDPQGLVLYGQALKRLGRTEEARRAFESAREAARTTPDFRRGQIRTWARLASEELGRI